MATASLTLCQKYFSDLILDSLVHNLNNTNSRMAGLIKAGDATDTPV